MNNGFSPSRRAWNRVMNALVWASAVLVMVLVAGIIGMVLWRGIPHISWEFLTTKASVLKGTDGILPAIINTLYVILLTLLIVLPLGVGAAVYLTEYATNRKLIEVIEFTNETLAGIPSIIYGLVGMLVFSQALGFQTCLLSGSLTLVVMNLAHHPHHRAALQHRRYRHRLHPCRGPHRGRKCRAAVHRRCGRGHRQRCGQGLHLQRRNPVGSAVPACL